MSLPVVEFRGVGFTYGAADRRSGRSFRLSAVDFDVRPGETLAVIGPNSAGKTTLVRLATRVLTPTAGEILVEGIPLRSLSARKLARRVAVVPQELPQGFPFTVEQLVLMGRYPHGPGRFFESDADRAIAREAMAAVGVLDLAAAPVDQVSGGERQRAVLARALAQRPRLLVLDEPTAHLDLKYQATCGALVRQLCAAEGVGVVIVSHDLNFAAELADRLLLLAGGRVIALGTPEEVLEGPRLAAIFDARLVVEKSAATGRPLVRLAWEEARPAREGR